MAGGSSYDRGSGQPTRILIINPNSSQEMTKGMLTAVEKMSLGDVGAYDISLIKVTCRPTASAD